MKKITLIVVFFATLFASNQLQAQEIDIAANWPNTDWEVVGSYSISGFLNDPTTTANFTFSDDLAGGGSLFDALAAQSPIIDLTAATTVVPAEEELILTLDYVYNQSGDELTLEWFDQSTHLWNIWDTFIGNSTNLDYETCSGMQTYTSAPLLINNFSPVQLLGFRYRLKYNDNGHTWGFCFGSPSIVSQETPLCMPVTGITADNIDGNSADINWIDLNSPAPANGWEVEYGDTGFVQGAGTMATTTSLPFVIDGLAAESCYDVYIRSVCDATISSTWTGPYNFCTVAAGPVCGGHFYDSGGSVNEYQNSESITTTISPEVAGDVVSILFTAFETEPGFDDLSIYDGPTAASPLLGVFDGTTIPPSFEATLANGGDLTFVFSSDGSVTRPGWESNIYCGPPTTCFMTENLAVSEPSITITEATVTWSDTNTPAGAPAGGWMIEYGPTGFEQGTGTTDAIPFANGAMYDISGLSGSTEYDFYIKAVCGANPNDDDSFYTGPVTFMTLCDIFPAPYSQDFSNDGEIPACWEQGANNNEDWMFTNDPVNPGTGTTSHIGNQGVLTGSTLSGGYFAWMDDSSPNSMNTTLLSPQIDLNGLAVPTLGFYFISNSESSNKNVNFSIDIWDGTTLHQEVYTHHGNSSGGWEQVFVDLGAFSNQVIQARFIVDEADTSFRDDFAIDDVYFGEMPTCVNVNNIVVENVSSDTLTVSWVDGGNTPAATAWEIEYGTPGFVTGSGTIVSAGANPFTVTGLIPQTDYEFYVRSVCGAGDVSLWAGPVPFTTLCAIFDAPYTEDFEDGGVIDDCWTQSDNLDPWLYTDDVTLVVGGFFADPHIGNSGNVGNTSESGGYFAFVDDSAPAITDNAITTPLVNLTPLADPSLSFYYLSHNEGNNNVDFSVDVWDGAQWNLAMFTSSMNTLGWQKGFVNLSGLTISGPVQARFVVDDNNGGGNTDDFALDDVTFDEAPSCYPVTNLAITNETQTTFDISWIDNNDVPPVGGWDVEVVWSTFPQGSVGNSITTVFTTNETITGLLPSTYYDVYVTANCGAGNSDPSISVGPIPIKTDNGFPLNDICSDAIELIVTTDCEPILGNNFQASDELLDSLATDCTANDGAVNGISNPNYDFDMFDVWYKFTMPATGTVIIQTGFAGWMEDSAVAIYTGSCGNLTVAENYNPDGTVNSRDTCSDDAIGNLGVVAEDDEMGIVQLINQTPGEVFYIRVWSVDQTNLPGKDNIQGQFSICVYGQPHSRPGPLDTNEETFVDNEFNLEYYPNPVTNILNLNADDKISEVRVYSLLGQEVQRRKLSTPSHDVSLDLEHLDAGTYFVKVLAGSKTKSVKIIKI